MSFREDSTHQYTDKREKLEYFLKTEEDVLFQWLGIRAFQIGEYGHYDPQIILKKDFLERGKKTF